jgi:quinol monooxygenase YgiN
MSEKKVTVIARLRAKAGTEEKVKHELIALVATTCSEPGCITYNLHQGADNKSLFLVYENWASRQDLDGHLKQPYLNSFLSKTGELLAEPVEITMWEKIS